MTVLTDTTASKLRSQLSTPGMVLASRMGGFVAQLLGEGVLMVIQTKNMSRGDVGGEVENRV
jgi:hypothetical protein